MSLVRHTAYNVAGFLAPLAISLLTVPIYLRVIGIERFGLLAICWTLLGFMGFLSLGMGPAVAQRLARESDSSAHTRSEVFWSAALVSAGMGVAGAILIWCLGDLYFQIVHVDEAMLRGEARVALPWLALSFFVSLSMGVLNGALQGRQWFGAMNALSIGTSVGVSVLPLCAALLIGPQLEMLMIGTLTAYVISYAVQLMVCRRAVPLSGKASPSVSVMRQLLSFGGWMTMVSMLAPIVTLSDRLVIGARLGSVGVSTYVVPYNLVSRVVALPASLSSASLPKLATARGEQEQGLLTQGLRILLALLTPLCVAGSAIIAPFLHFWIGDPIAVTGSVVGCILIFGFWMHGVAHIPSTVLLGRGRPDVVATLLGSFVVPYLALLFVCLNFLGVVGAAVAWAARASAEMFLFCWARPHRREAHLTIACGVLVFTASITAFVLDWRSVEYWLALATLTAVSIAIGLFILRKETPAGRFRLTEPPVREQSEEVW